MKTSEIIKWGFGIIAFVFLTAILFNHVNPWAGILFAMGGVYLVARKFD